MTNDQAALSDPRGGDNRVVGKFRVLSRKLFAVLRGLPPLEVEVLDVAGRPLGPDPLSLDEATFFARLSPTLDTNEIEIALESKQEKKQRLLQSSRQSMTDAFRRDLWKMDDLNDEMIVKARYMREDAQERAHGPDVVGLGPGHLLSYRVGQLPNEIADLCGKLPVLIPWKVIGKSFAVRGVFGLLVEIPLPVALLEEDIPGVVEWYFEDTVFVSSDLVGLRAWMSEVIRLGLVRSVKGIRLITHRGSEMYFSGSLEELAAAKREARGVMQELLDDMTWPGLWRILRVGWEEEMVRDLDDWPVPATGW